MVKYREVLRLAAMGVSQNSIAYSCGCAQSTVSDVWIGNPFRDIFFRD